MVIFFVQLQMSDRTEAQKNANILAGMEQELVRVKEEHDAQVAGLEDRITALTKRDLMTR